MQDMESGDLGYHWTCALCQHPAGKSNEEDSNSPSDIVSAINAISEKFELVNKIQLPRLSGDLMHIKNVTDRIAEQSDNILRSIEQLKANREKTLENNRRRSSYRKRHLTLMPKTKTHSQNQQAPVQPSTDKLVRYRTRRRSSGLHKMFLLLNRKLRQTSVLSK
ncbi:unnamed protein product [Parnassius apollo]|uniref:(apollo) hypothetical protein n=1 Tax=Parnassius apollo TaxID=110799 RepID=A0A8S3X7K1_PARAO|nr:unnamed protein product [Parnassius apollo]